MSLYIIANPHSGKGSAADIVEKIQNLCPQKEIRIFYTQKKDDEKRQVQAILTTFQKEDQIIIIGGDGTLSKVLFHLPAEIPFAYYPVGSGNDFAHSLPFPTLEEILQGMEEKKYQPLTVFGYENGILLNSLDVGFAAWVVHEAADSRLKHLLNQWHLGKLTYIFVAIQSLFKNPAATVAFQVEEKEKVILENHFFFSVANNTYFGGGIMIWPTAGVKTDSLEIVATKGQTFFQRLSTLLALVSKKHQTCPYLQHQTVEELWLEIPEGTIVEVDGEILDLQSLHLQKQTRYIYL